MLNANRRIPLWVIVFAGASGIITLLGLFFYGSYVGLGSSL